MSVGLLMMTPTHVWSDTHFGHTNILRYSCRPFATIDEHDDVLIANHNALVGPDDLVLHVGDFALCHKDRARAVAARLNGRRILVRGNHDRWTVTAYRELGFELAVSRFQFEVAPGVHFVATHRPGATLADTVRVHGHTHQKTRRDAAGRLHVGVDAWDYRPAKLAELCALTGLSDQT